MPSSPVKSMFAQVAPAMKNTFSTTSLTASITRSLTARKLYKHQYNQVLRMSEDLSHALGFVDERAMTERQAVVLQRMFARGEKVDKMWRKARSVQDLEDVYDLLALAKSEVDDVITAQLNQKTHKLPRILLHRLDRKITRDTIKPYDRPAVGGSKLSQVVTAEYEGDVGDAGSVGGSSRSSGSGRSLGSGVWERLRAVLRALGGRKGMSAVTVQL